MADPYGRHHTAIVVKWNEMKCLHTLNARRRGSRLPLTLSLFEHTHTHIIITLFWNSSTLTLVCVRPSHMRFRHRFHSRRIQMKYILFGCFHPMPNDGVHVCFVRVWVFFLIFAWYRLITHPCPYIFEHHRIGNFSMFYYCNLCCGNFNANDKTWRKIYFIYFVWVCMLKYNSNWTRSYFFSFWDWDCVCMIIAMISIDLDKVQSTGNHRTCEN